MNGADGKFLRGSNTSKVDLECHASGIKAHVYLSVNTEDLIREMIHSIIGQAQRIRHLGIDEDSVSCVYL